jgi:hypothetical protein
MFSLFGGGCFGLGCFGFQFIGIIADTIDFSGCDYSCSRCFGGTVKVVVLFDWLR